MSDESKNPFLNASKDVIRPNAVFSPQNYERVGLYVLLYNEILGSLQDYQGSRLDLDVLVNQRIQDVMKIASKIFKNRALGLDDENGLNTADPNFGFAKQWIKDILPLEKGIQKDADGKEIYIDPDHPLYDPEEAKKNATYCDEFLKNYELVKGEEKRIASIMGKDVLSLKDGLLLLDAKRSKVREFYEMVRGNGDYKPGKIDKKDGSSKNGIHAAAYFAALNELQKKNRKLHRHAFFNALKGAAAIGLAAVTVVSAGALLSYGGFALTAMFGTVFNPVGVGAATLGGLGTLFGFYGSKNMFKRFRDGLKKSRKLRDERREFVGKKYRGKDIEVFLGVNWNKDGKGMTLNEKKVLFMFDRAARAFFEKKGGKNDPEFPPELKQYLPDSLIKKWKLEGDKKHFDAVSSSSGIFERLKKKYPNVVDALAMTDETGKPTKRENLGEARDLVKNAGSLEDVFKANRYLDDYSGNMAHEHVADLRRQLAAKTVETLKSNIFENAYTSTTLGNAHTDLAESRVTAIMEHSATTGEKVRLSNALSFLGAEESRKDSPISKTLGVKVGSQYDITESAISSACRTLDNAMSAADAAAVQAIAHDIASVTTKSTASAIPTAIAGISSPAVQTYLTHMLDKKVAGSVNDGASILLSIDPTSSSTATDVARIANTIAGLTKVTDNKMGDKFVSGTHTIDSIREWIMKPTDLSTGYIGLNPTEQAEAMRLLDEQVDSIRFGEDTKARAEAFKAVQSGGATFLKDGKPVQLDEIVATISSLTYDKINASETFVFFDTTILNATPKGVSNYLKNMFKNKVQDLFVSYIADHASELETGNEALAKVGEFLSRIQNCKFLDDGQKQFITGEIEPKLENAFASTLRDMEKKLLHDVKANTYSAQLIKFIEQPYSGQGFVDYFNKNTLTSNKVLDRITRLQRGLQLTSLLTAGGKEEVPLIIDENSADTESFLAVYFDEGESRGHSDLLVNKLHGLELVSKNADYEKLTTNDVVPGADNFVEMMTDYINNQIMGDGTLSDKDKLAALLVAKKRSLAMFKSHMMKYIQPGLGNPASYIRGAGMTALNNIKNAWKPLMSAIDSHYATLQTRPSNAKYVRTYKSAALSIDEGTNSANFMNFAKAEQLQP